jgi:hypothetical protein
LARQNNFESFANCTGAEFGFALPISLMLFVVPDNVPTSQFEN